MRFHRKTLLAAVMALALPAIGSAQDEGMIPRWEVESMTEDIVKNVASGQKLLLELRPEEWIQDGAPAAYVEQLATLQSNLENTVRAAEALGRNPERLSYAVDTFLWLDRSDSLLSSMIGGVRKYYNSVIADLLDAARGRNNANIANLKTYMRQLSVEIETSMAIAHSEAQRCRAAITNQPRQP